MYARPNGITTIGKAYDSINQAVANRKAFPTTARDYVAPREHKRSKAQQSVGLRAPTGRSNSFHITGLRGHL